MILEGKETVKLTNQPLQWYPWTAVQCVKLQEERDHAD